MQVRISKLTGKRVRVSVEAVKAEGGVRCGPSGNFVFVGVLRALNGRVVHTTPETYMSCAAAQDAALALTTAVQICADDLAFFQEAAGHVGQVRFTAWLILQKIERGTVTENDVKEARVFIDKVRQSGGRVAGCWTVDNEPAPLA